MTGLLLLLPELVLAGLALGIMLADLFVPTRHSKILYHLGWIAGAITLCLVGYSLTDPLACQGLGQLWAVDPMSQYFKVLILITTILALLLGFEYRALPHAHAGSFTALLLFSALGLMLLVSATDVLLIFLSLELVSISSFILTGFERGNPKSNEGAIKYFLFGAFSSAIMIYGISLYYGATGKTGLIGVSPHGTLMLLALLLMLVGFGFKASVAPMHFWVPDAYEGAPTPVTAFLSIAPKIATLGALLRVYSLLIPAASMDLTMLLALLSGLTMTIGNFTALFQTDVKRLLAYSSVAQAGYMLIGIVAGDAAGLEGVMLYSFIYVAMNIGAFAVAIAVANSSDKGYDLEAYNGLSRRSLGTALVMAFFLLSLSGIPPMAGFIGKFYIFSSAVGSGHWGLAVLGVLNSVVSVYYYLRIVHNMFLRPAESNEPLKVGSYLISGIALAAAIVLIFGVLPEPLIAHVQASAQFLP